MKRKHKRKHKHPHKHAQQRSKRSRTTRKRTMAMPKALAAWHRAHPKKGAKRRRRNHHSSSPPKKRMSRKHHSKFRRRARRHGRQALGVLQQLLPTVPEAVSIGAAALYGRIEGDASKDANHFLRKVPAPLTVIGRSGNLGLGLWLLGALTKQPLVRAAATGVVDVAAYQMLRRPESYGKAGENDIEFKLSGYGYPRRGGRDPVPRMVDRYVRGDDDAADDDDDDDAPSCG